jgi:hypothetical protein
MFTAFAFIARVGTVAVDAVVASVAGTRDAAFTRLGIAGVLGAGIVVVGTLFVALEPGASAPTHVAVAVPIAVAITVAITTVQATGAVAITVAVSIAARTLTAAASCAEDER